MNTIDLLLDLMRSTTSLKRHNIRAIYLARFGSQIIPHCVRHYLMQPPADFRADLLRFLLNYARDSQQVIEFAVTALDDRSQKVRHNACAVLAYSLKQESIPFLKGAMQHTNPKTVEDARRAIDAVESQNHNRFYPYHSSWGVTPDDPLHPRRESVRRFIVEQAPELVSPLTEILGDIYSPRQ